MKLVDKDALVAEIERLMTPECGYSMNKLIDFLESLEVKEVDLKKEIQDKIYNHFYDLEGIAIAGTSIYATVGDMEHIARHFFELGLKAQKGE